VGSIEWNRDIGIGRNHNYSEYEQHSSPIPSIDEFTHFCTIQTEGSHKNNLNDNNFFLN